MFYGGLFLMKVGGGVFGLFCAIILGTLFFRGLFVWVVGGGCFLFFFLPATTLAKTFEIIQISNQNNEE